jgi:hypothetical protein
MLNTKAEFKKLQNGKKPPNPSWMKRFERWDMIQVVWEQTPKVSSNDLRKLHPVLKRQASVQQHAWESRVRATRHRMPTPGRLFVQRPGGAGCESWYYALL